MLTLDTTILQTVITQAQRAAADAPRWLNAIKRAAIELETNPYIEAVDDHTLLIASESGNVYSANGVCQCTAYQHGQPCFHRAMSRLYTRYVEAERKQGAAAKATAEINELF